MIDFFKNLMKNKPVTFWVAVTIMTLATVGCAIGIVKEIVT